MNKELNEIRDRQRETWDKFSPGWKKWDELTMDFLRPMGEEIIKLLNLKENDNVLDIAAGTGEPGLTIAGIVKNGKVTITDLSEKMIEIARENAAKRGIKNIETVACDVCELPFPDNSFDAISCRFGFMFFPDMMLAAKEMHRVLKPGGGVATSVWGVPEKNFWVTVSTGIIKKYVEMPVSPPGAPGMFRCADKNFISDLFKQAGFKKVSEQEVTGKFNCGTAEIYWEMMSEVGAPIVAALREADERTKEQIVTEILQTLNQRFPNGNIEIDSSAQVIFGEK